ncbi:MAG: hypothetical protein WD022_08140 [Balneolaceae bacterium]
MKTSYILLLVSLLLLLSGCFDTEDIPVYEDVEGVVLLNGEPVANADIHIRNHFNPGGFSFPQDPLEDYSFIFNTPTDGQYIASLFRHGADTVYATFFDARLEFGQNEIQIPDTLLTNGIVGYQVSSPVTRLAADLFLVNKPDSTLPESLPFAKTGLNGQFLLNAAYLALGRSFRTGSGSGFEVNDSLQIIIVRDEQIIRKEEVYIAPDQSNFFEINLD